MGTLLIAVADQDEEERADSPLSILSDHAWLGLGYGCSAVIAGLLQASFGSLQPSSVIVAVVMTTALLAMSHLYYRQASIRRS